ncbi:MAG TPA: hypothetical protein VEF91_05330 [Verrucomicrobiae bacterium]|nr:hypothetical protein [Verrucomicrobiae bacterium]
MTKLRELKEIAKDLNDINEEMKKRILNLEKASTREEWAEVLKKEINLEREFHKSLEKNTQ